jgi:hypothetical protein
MTYPLVEDEAMRLEAVRALQIVDTPRTTAFDTIATLAADLFACPIAFISLVDKDRQWFKAECGLGLSSTPRGVAFCNYTTGAGVPIRISNLRGAHCARACRGGRGVAPRTPVGRA